MQDKIAIEQPDTLVVFTVPADVLAELAAQDRDMFRAHGERFLFIAEETE